MKQRLHNKSRITNLKVLSFDDETLFSFHTDILSRAIVTRGLIPLSPCWIYSTADGRYTHMQVKVAYAYQICSTVYFGRHTIELLASNKFANDLCLSHLCGKHRCVNPDHITVEPKFINDERTHCHFVMNRCKKLRTLKSFHRNQMCPHNPVCGKLAQ